ncbi:MAG: WD40/YVTN/BNR-like repeat-containing protein [Candidatus Dormibacteraceae bacterium]
MSDDLDEDAGLSQRARHALPLMAGALAAIVVVGLVYLHPALPARQTVLGAAATPPPPLVPERYIVAYDFLTPEAGWAVVEEGTSAAPRFWVFKTSDSARHWQRQFVGSASSLNAGPLKIQFFDRSNGLVALGGSAAAYRTGDGGNHWTALTMPAFSYSSVYFSDRLHGWIMGTVLSPDQRTADSQFFSTSDAGDHWVSLPQPPAWEFAAKGGFSNFVFRTPREGWMGGFAQGQAVVYSTVDAGHTWQPHPLPVTSAKGGLAEGSAPLLGSSVYLLPGHGLLAVADDLNAGPVGLTSFDGGTTWRRLPSPPGNAGYADFVFQDASHWWAMRFGALFKSSDAGMSWKQVSLQLDDWNYLPQVIDAKHAWAQMVGVAPGLAQAPGTGLAVTSDGGLHWTPVQVPVPS